MKIEPANKAGATMVIAKWFAETPNGWIASHDLAALQAIARRLDAAEQMAQALRYLAHSPVMAPLTWDKSDADAALAAWEVAK